MSNVTFKETYNWLLYEIADPRTKDWPLLNPTTFFAIFFGYLYFILSLGPRLMKNRQPFSLRRVLVFYNIIEILVSIWLFKESLDAAWLRNYNWSCEPVDRSESPHAMRVARGVYVFYLAKTMELLDTIFFILRKKYNQVSFLHVYHHGTMIFAGWGAARFFPGGHVIFMGFINSFIHIVMYTYYLVTAMGPQYQKYLWWKSYITVMQLVQFPLVFIHDSQALLYGCGFPTWVITAILVNCIFFFYLFGDFYWTAYIKSERLKQSKKEEKGIKAQ